MKVLTLCLSTLALQLGTPLTDADLFGAGSEVAVEISTPRSTVTIRDEIHVRYRLLNLGARPLFVPRGFEATACLEPHHPPMIWAWLQNAGGHYFSSGYGVSCGSSVGALPLTLEEWLRRGATLLQPGGVAEGMLQLPAASGAGATPGNYRVGVTLRGWDERSFPRADFDRARGNGIRLLRGAITASVDVTLIGAFR